MFNRVKSVLYNVVGGLEALPGTKDGEAYSDGLPLKFRYSRPHFLHFTTDDEIQVSADHVIRPIIVPRDITKLPWNSGYAEAINAGKSKKNEDQSATHRGVLYPSISPETAASTLKRLSVATTINQASSSNSTVKSERGTTSTVVNNETAATSSKSNTDPSSNSKADTTVENKNVSPEEPKFRTPPSTPEPVKKPKVDHTIPWVYFGTFDGHAGSGVAVAAANTLHKIIQEKLQSVCDLLLPAINNGAGDGCISIPQNLMMHPMQEKRITIDSLIVGALETAFWDMDKLIAEDKKRYTMTGGCTALAAVFILGKLYLANAGDSRAVLCRGLKVIPMSGDFTPQTENVRIRKLGLLRPELLGGEFTYLEFARRPGRKDLGKKMLYRDAYMTGWAYKTITVDDLKFPLIIGEGKCSRVMATIGVTRGFGDHDLKVVNSGIEIKPFLSAQPEVRIFDINVEDITDSDVLIMGTDGLWDVTSNEKAAEVVQKSLDHFPANDTQRFKYRYTSAAQDLVMHSRGKLRERNWRTAENKSATIDDISVFVIPLRPYKEEYFQWKASRDILLSDGKP